MLDNVVRACGFLNQWNKFSKINNPILFGISMGIAMGVAIGTALSSMTFGVSIGIAMSVVFWASARKQTNK